MTRVLEFKYVFFFLFFFFFDTIDARISGSMCRVVSRDLRFYCKPKMRQLFVIALRAVRYCSPNEGKKENAKEGNCILQGRRKV